MSKDVLNMEKGLIVREKKFDVYDMIAVHNAYRKAAYQEDIESKLKIDLGVDYTVSSSVTEKMASEMMRYIDKYDYNRLDALTTVCDDYFTEGKLLEGEKSDSLRHFEIKGINLDMELMRSINGYYEVAATQEFLYENYNVSVAEAENIATFVRKAMSEDYSLKESDVIHSLNYLSDLANTESAR